VVDNTSKRQRRIKFFKFFLRLVPFIIVIAVFGAYLIVAAYFMDTLIMTAYSYRPLNDTIQLTRNMLKPHLGSYASQVLASSVPQFIVITSYVALVLVWIDVPLKLWELWERLTKPQATNREH
jgi:hypothetical protein